SSKYFITLNTANVTLTLEDIILDGGGQELACTSTSPLVYLRNGNLVINDGAVLQNNYSGNGGGVYVYGANASLYMNGGSIINNSATYGSAIYNYNSAAVEINGGILSAADGSADLIFVALSRPLSLGSVATTGNVNSIYVNNQPAANTIQVTAPLVGPFSYVPGGTTSTSNGRALFKGTDEYALTSADAEKVTIAVENRSLVLDAENNQLVVSAPTYDINIPVMEHGSISASPSPCTPGETVTLTVTPEVSEENGTYRLWEESLTVTAASGAELELTKSSSNYTFTMPNEAVNVSSATFKRVRNVTVASGIVGGTITTSANTRVEGDTVTITAVANSYWSIASLSYTAAGSDESVEIPLASLSGRTATFIMPDADLQISGTFSEQPYDVSWYNTTDTEFTLTSAAQLWGLSRIVNNKAEASEAGIVEGIDPSIPADDFQGKTVHLATDVDLGAVQISAGGYDDAGNWTEPSWSGTEWVPIGSYTSSGLHSTGSENGLYGRPFKGTFDGGYHRISNLYVPYYGTSDDSAEGNCHGLFGDLGQAGVVKNVVVTSGFIKGARFNGAIVGRNWGGVENCASYAFVQANGRAGAGGITGCNYNNGHLPYVLNCIAYGEIYNPKTTTSGTPSAGGITATNEGTLTNCLFVGKVGTGAATVNCGGLTTGTLTDRLINSWYRDGARVRAANLNDTAYAKAADEIKTAEFAAAMGEAYAYVEGDWPVLAGTLPEAEPEPEVDTSWYNSTDTSFTLYSASDLKGLAAIVNGTADGIAQDDFAGKTVSLGADIALAEDGLYTAATGIYGAGSYKMQATYYILDESAPIWTPIGSGVATDNSTFSSSNWFAGSFDGQGYTISGIYTDGSATVQGLFGNVSGSVSNLTVSGCVQGDFVVGAAVAHLAGGSVSNVTNNAVVFSDGGESPDSGLENGVSKAGATGGIVGSAEGTSEAPFAITGCTNNGDVTCANTAKGGRTGGILGIVDKTTFVGSISQNINNGHVESYQYAGGVVGANFSTAAPISQCVNHGKVMLNASGSGYAGGIVSQCYSPVSYCYNTGQYGGRLLSGDKVSHIGGIVSDLFSPATVSNCYNVGSFCREGTPVISTTSSTGKIVGSGGGKHSTTAANIFNSYFLLTGSAEKEYADADASLGGQGWLPLGAGMSASEMKTGEFALLLNGDEGADGLFRSDYAGEDAINGGYPVLAFEGGTTPVASGGIAQSGDLDGDGVVTAADALRAAQAVISGGGSLTAMQFAAADIDGDGYLTMADAIKIVRRAAGLG
ncbi:MAG: dockerin type I domain-containing protein, partial [Coriobacteriales bacterium]|nr:dockerin type I domain-containing protein [Coriobacteriales bacterium]